MRELNVGDQIVIQRRTGIFGNRPRFTIRTIAKKTATQITLDDGERYMLRTGERYGNGDSYHGSCLATHWDPQQGTDYMTIEQAQELIEKDHKEQAIFEKKSKIKNIVWKSASDEQITAIYDLAKQIGLIREE